MAVDTWAGQVGFGIGDEDAIDKHNERNPTSDPF